MKKSIIVVTGPPSDSNPAVALKISAWLGCTVLLTHPILEGLRPVSLSFKEGELLDGLRPGNDDELQKTPPMQLAQAVLRSTLHHVRYLVNWVGNDQADGGSSQDSCFVLEFPVAAAARKLLYILHEKLQVELDRGLIIECIPQKESHESGNHEMWSRRWSRISSAIEELLCSKSDQLNSSFDRERVSILKADLRIYINPSLTSQLRRRKKGRFSRSGEKGLDRHHEGLPPFFQAVDYLLFKHDLEEQHPLCMTMREWGEYKINYLKHGRDWNIIKAKMMPSCFAAGRGFHDMINETQLLPWAVHLANKYAIISCDRCSHRITSGHPFYCCSFCRYYLHEYCAELDGISTNKSFPSALTPKVCGHCKILKLNTFSKDCSSCLYYSVLKSYPLPAIIHHPLVKSSPPLSQDFLQLQTCYKDNENQYCAACDQTFKKEYRYFHKPSSLYYGAACVARLPVTIEHTHFGCRRPLKLRNTPNEEMDYYLCHFCMEERDGRHWYYFCDHCQYSAHPFCICPDEKEYH